MHICPQKIMKQDNHTMQTPASDTHNHHHHLNSSETETETHLKTTQQVVQTPAPDTHNHHHDLLNLSETETEPEKEKWCGHEYLYKFHGFWFTETYLKTTQQVVQTFKPLPKDVILASFPKTGTTWLKALLHSIIHRSNYNSKDHQNPLLSKHPQDLILSLETGIYVNYGDSVPDFLAAADERETRIFGTHIPYQILGETLNSSECKIVYVTRNPKDTLVSLWHFLQKSHEVKEDPWQIKTAVDHFCKGFVPFGSYYDHVLGYREESLKRPQKLFFVTYEELKDNPKLHVRKLGEFLGCPFEGEDEEIEKIVRICSFEVLSNQEVNKSSELPSGFMLPYNSFFRKGEVGDNINCLKPDMIHKIDDFTKQKFHATGFHYGI